MGSTDEVQPIDMVEVGDDFVTEEPAGSSHIGCPGSDVIRVRPHKISIWSFHGDFLSSVDGSNLVDGDYLFGESSVDAENSVIDEGTDREAVEKVTEKSPGSIVTVFPGDFLIESVGHGDISGLVVSSEEGDLVWVFHFEAEEILHCFDGVVTSIDEVSDEDVFVVWEFSSYLEEFKKVEELPMDITADVYWGTNGLNVRFFEQDFAGGIDDLFEFSFIEEIFVFVIGVSEMINQSINIKHFFQKFEEIKRVCVLVFCFFFFIKTKCI